MTSSSGEGRNICRSTPPLILPRYSRRPVMSWGDRMTGAQVLICDLPLPRTIQEAIDNKTWTLPADSEMIEQTFTETKSGDAELYQVTSMISETEAWANESEEQLSLYGGRDSAVDGYLTLDPRKSVLIGDLGVDRPIALDYSISPERPRVLYRPSRAPGWIEIASNVASFLERLGISSSTVSPRIRDLSWGRMEVAGLGEGKDFVLYPGGGVVWDWSLTGTRHAPGIQPADVATFIERRCSIVVLSRGMELRLHVMAETLRYLENAEIQVHVAETSTAASIYNELAAHDHRVGGLFHSTC